MATKLMGAIQLMGIVQLGLPQIGPSQIGPSLRPCMRAMARQNRVLRSVRTGLSRPIGLAKALLHERHRERHRSGRVTERSCFAYPLVMAGD